jgi:DNA-binding transcriptional LysR family regulator
MIFTLRPIEAVRAVMPRGSISGAGVRLGLTQPAVSRLMRDMQEVLNLKLFLRRRNSIAATAEATLLFEEVQRSFVSLHRIERTAQEFKCAWHGSLRISAMAGPAHGFLPGMVARFLSEQPDTFVALHNHITTTTLERVSLRQFDIGIAYAPPDCPGLEIERLPSLEAVCALPADHALAPREVITLEDLRGQNLLTSVPAARSRYCSTPCCASLAFSRRSWQSPRRRRCCAAWSGRGGHRAGRSLHGCCGARPGGGGAAIRAARRLRRGPDLPHRGAALAGGGVVRRGSARGCNHGPATASIALAHTGWSRHPGRLTLRSLAPATIASIGNRAAPGAAQGAVSPRGRV